VIIAAQMARDDGGLLSLFNRLMLAETPQRTGLGMRRNLYDYKRPSFSGKKIDNIKMLEYY
jgi:hypothetical protein